MAKQTLVPRDEDFPEYVVHIANRNMRMRVVAYGLLSALYGGVPVVATDDKGGWYAGEADVIAGEPTLLAVNGYGDESTARRYAESIFVL